MKKLILSYLIFSITYLNLFATDSLSNQNLKNASFYLKANRSSIGFLVGLYRSRIANRASSFKLPNIGFNINVDLPFSYVLKYYDRLQDEILKLNMSVFMHISRYGNHGVGLALRARALIYKNFFMAYQLGLGRFEPVRDKVNDGLSNRGMQFNHILMLSKQIDQHFEPYLALIHTSNGSSVGRNGSFWGSSDNQDMIAIGLAYHF